MQKIESLQAIVLMLKRSWFCGEKQGNIFKKESLLITVDAQFLIDDVAHLPTPGRILDNRV
jgi:hypothetical protein